MARVHSLPEAQKVLQIQVTGHFYRLANRIAANLIQAGYFIQRESMKIVPIHQGNLRASAYTRFTGSGMTTQVFVGYTASYALFVHEIVEYAHGAAFNAKHADKIAGLNGKKKVRTLTIDGWKTRTKTVRHPYYFNRGVAQQSKFLTVIIYRHAAEIKAILNRGLVK